MRNSFERISKDSDPRETTQCLEVIDNPNYERVEGAPLYESDDPRDYQVKSNILFTLSLYLNDTYTEAEWLRAKPVYEMVFKVVAHWFQKRLVRIPAPGAQWGHVGAAGKLFTLRAPAEAVLGPGDLIA